MKQTTNIMPNKYRNYKLKNPTWGECFCLSNISFFNYISPLSSDRNVKRHFRYNNIF